MSVGHVAARVSHVDEQSDASALSGLMGIRPQVVFPGSRPWNRPRTDPPGDPGPPSEGGSAEGGARGRAAPTGGVLFCA